MLLTRGEEKRTNVLEAHVTKKGMLKISTDYYKNLFRKEERPDITLGSDFFPPEEKVIAQELVDLEKVFSEQEIKEDV
jgi:hypothetical protein